MTTTSFDFIPRAYRPPKPRTVGLTEIRGPYYTPVGRHYLTDLLETMGAYVDTLKTNGRTVELLDAQDMDMQVTDMRVVAPPVPQGHTL